MIIDFHTHTFPDRIAAAAMSKMEKSAHAKAFADGTRDSLLRMMQNAGVAHAVVLPVATKPMACASLNDASHVLDGRDQLTYFAAIHPDAPDWHAELGRAKTQGFRGVKLHPVYQGVDIDDPRFVRILARCGELGLMVVMHGGEDISYPGVARCSPPMLRRALAQAGPVTLIAAHMGGWRNWQEVPEMLLDTGVYLDTSFTLGDICPLDDHYKPEQLKMLADERFCELVHIFGSKRVLFGTDSPWYDPAVCIERIRSMPLTDTEKKDILGDNARQLLGL
ncbi:MAG: amidohydrolase family protein [Clostridia bacterium]|nr:amidohydrolase family protein [Clostridia bacterium]